MSLFGDLAGNLLNEALSGQTPAAQGSTLSAVLDLVNQHGGLPGLIQQLQSGGLSEAVQSWIGSGANQPVSGAQITQALNGTALAAFAQKLGIDPAQAGPLLAQLLPQVIDHLTPSGQIGEHATLGEAAASLLRGKLFG